jgi:hypothetical protein
MCPFDTNTNQYMTSVELRKQKAFVRKIALIGRKLCKDTNLCGITKKGCRKYTFEDNPSLCCSHCPHLEIGKGCKTISPSCCLGVCNYGDISTKGFNEHLLTYFGNENYHLLQILANLRCLIRLRTDLELFSRLTIEELFSENPQEINKQRIKEQH